MRRRACGHGAIKRSTSSWESTIRALDVVGAHQALDVVATDLDAGASQSKPHLAVAVGEVVRRVRAPNGASTVVEINAANGRMMSVTNADPSS